LKRDHQTNESTSSNKSLSIKKFKQQHNNNLMDKDTRNRYPSGSSSSTLISSQNSTKKLVIKNLKS
jgi:hypothetical protein